jgi:hypothetical protein
LIHSDAESPSEETSAAQDAAAERRRKHWLNITLVVGLIIAGIGFYVETRRALEGHLPAWVYVVEWPLLGFVGFRIWQRLIREDTGTSSTESESDDVVRESWKDFSARNRPHGPDET